LLKRASSPAPRKRKIARITRASWTLRFENWEFT
jgi:hypothetical protein